MIKTFLLKEDPAAHEKTLRQLIQDFEKIVSQ